MYYLLYKMNDAKKGYIVARMQNDEELDLIMTLSFVTPLLITTSFETVKISQNNYNKKRA